MTIIVTHGRHFTEQEFACECGCGECGMDAEFVSMLDQARDFYGRPMVLSSARRCSEHNNRVSSTGYFGPHTTGKAADVLCHGGDAHRLLEIAMRMGFTGIGIAQKGPHESRFIHLDILRNEQRPWVWSY